MVAAHLTRTEREAILAVDRRFGAGEMELFEMLAELRRLRGERRKSRRTEIAEIAEVARRGPLGQIALAFGGPQ